MDELRDVTIAAYYKDQLGPFKTWKLYPFSGLSSLRFNYNYEATNICNLYAQVFIFGDTTGLTSSQISQLPFEVRK